MADFQLLPLIPSASRQFVRPPGIASVVRLSGQGGLFQTSPLVWAELICPLRGNGLRDVDHAALIRQWR